MTYKQEQQEIYQKKTEKLIKGFPSFFEEYIMSLKSAKTRYNNMLVISDWLAWMQKNEYIKSYESEEIEKITTGHIIKYLDTFIYELKMSTVIRKKSVIGGFLDFLFLRKYISCNVEKYIPQQRFKEENKNYEVKIPSEEDIQDLFYSIRHMPRAVMRLRWNAVVNLLMGTGIRSDELIGLNIEDLHLDEAQPYIEVIGKGNQNSKDEVKISKNRVQAVKDYLIWRNNNNFDTDALFVSGYRKRLSKGSIDRFFRESTDGKIKPHMLRHWCASKMYSECCDIEVVKRQLRHTNIHTTIKYYVKGDDKKFLNTLNCL